VTDLGAGYLIALAAPSDDGIEIPFLLRHVPLRIQKRPEWVYVMDAWRRMKMTHATSEMRVRRPKNITHPLMDSMSWVCF